MAKVGKNQLIKLLSDRKRKQLVDSETRTLVESLWRDALMLYVEKCDRGSTGTPTGYIQSIISPDVNFGTAIGQKNLVEGNESVVIGKGGNSKSFLEIIMGAYATTATGSATEWTVTDRLLALGNGTDAETRSNALEVFKSGLFKLFNALVIGKFEHGNELPVNGTLQFDELELQVFANGFWKMLLTDAPNDNKPYGRKSKAWTEVAALDHDHEIGNVALLFENQLT